MENNRPPSNSLITFRENIEALFSSYVSISLYKALKDLLEFEKLHKKQDAELLKIIELINKNLPYDSTYNYYYSNIISSLELYLKQRVFEQLPKDKKICDKFLREYNLQKKITVNDVINGPLLLVEEILNDVIYHNISKVDVIYKIIFGFSIVPFVSIRKLKADIDFRHILIHNAGYINKKKLHISELGFCDTLGRVSKFVEGIDFYIRTGKKRKSYPNYLARFDKIYNNVRELKSYDSMMIGAIINAHKNINYQDIDKRIVY